MLAKKRLQHRIQKEIGWVLREKYEGKETPCFLEDILRLEKGEPVDYILGSTPFLNSVIDVSVRPFIPRTETEFWVLKAIEEIIAQKHKSSVRCLDIFSGSGCIGVSLLKHLPTSTVTFGEKHEKYIQQIKKNIELNNIDHNRVKVIQTDILESISGSFDYIFANPPYISKDRLHTVGENVIDFEPHEALFAGENGLLYIKALLNKAHDYLLPGGKLFIEFDSWQKQLIEDYLYDVSHKYTNVEFWDDIYMRPRVITVTKPIDNPS